MEWRVIQGFSSYEVSSNGQVRRATEGKTCAGKIIPVGYILSPKRAAKGYLVYALIGDDRKVKHLLSHRLVALAFIGPCPMRGYIVCHKNGEPGDNRVENLKWASNSQNQLDRRMHGTSTDGHRHPFAKLNVEQVQMVISMWKSGMSQSEIARHFDVVPHTICRIVNGKSYTATTQGEFLCPA
jgi:hypothetical protein